jgi:hypothetical protein
MGVNAEDRLRREDPDYPASSAAEQQAVLPWLVRAHAAVLRARDHAATAVEQMAGLPGYAAAVASDAGSSDEQQQQRQPAVGEYDHYRVLDLPADFTSEQLRRAYKVASLRAHPDRRGASPAAPTLHILCVCPKPGRANPSFFRGKLEKAAEGIDDDRTDCFGFVCITGGSAEAFAAVAAAYETLSDPDKRRVTL